MPRKNQRSERLDAANDCQTSRGGTAIAPPQAVLDRLGLRLNRQPKGGPKPIEGVHRSNGDREIHKVLRREGGAGCRVGFIGGVGLAEPA